MIQFKKLRKRFLFSLNDLGAEHDTIFILPIKFSFDLFPVETKQKFFGVICILLLFLDCSSENCLHFIARFLNAYIIPFQMLKFL